MFSALRLTGFFLRGLLTAAIPFAAFRIRTAAGILLTVLLCIIVRLHGKQFTGGTI